MYKCCDRLEDYFKTSQDNIMESDMKYKKKEVAEVHPCAGCHYWRPCGLDHCCNYIFIEGHMRGCAPGSECTKKIPMNAAKLQQEKQELYQNMYFGKQPLRQIGGVK